MRLYLIRHGAVENPGGVRYGRLPGFPLSAEGRAQAARTAQHLASLRPGPLRLLSSPLARAHETATIVGAPLSLTPDIEPRLLELGSSLDGLPRRVPLPVRLRHLRDPALRRMNEPLRFAAQRILSVIDEHQPRFQALVLVSHQLPIRAALLALTRGLRALDGPLPASWWLRLRQPLDPTYAQLITLAPCGPHRWAIVASFCP